MNEKFKANARKGIIVLLILVAVVALIYTIMLYIASKSVSTQYDEIDNVNLLTVEACSSWVDGVASLYSIGTEEDQSRFKQEVAIDSKCSALWFNEHPIDGVKRTANVISVMYVLPETEPIMTTDSKMQYLVTLQINEPNDSYIKYVGVTYANGKIQDVVEVV